MAARDLAFRKYSVAADADMTSGWPLDRRICFIANIRDRFKTKVTCKRLDYVLSMGNSG